MSYLTPQTLPNTRQSGIDAQWQVRIRAAMEVYGVMPRTRGAFETVFGPGTRNKLITQAAGGEKPAPLFRSHARGT